jgi:hypothetical protein
MRTRFGGLWGHPDFMKLWVGETISLLGSQVTALALPLTAALILQASSEQMGILNAVFPGADYQVSLRQTITPHRLLGRMSASMRFIVWGTIPVGALIGGALGGAIGLRQILVVGAVGSLLPSLWIIFSPVRGLREQPQPIEEAAGTG